MNLTEEIALVLDDLGIVDFDPAGGDAFLEKLPQTPDDAVALMSTGGYPSDSRLGYASPTFQVIVRGTADPRPAQERAQQVYDALHGLRNVELPGGTWLVACLGIQSGPIHLGRDEDNRHMYSLNFQAEIRRVTSHSDDYVLGT